VAQPYLDQLKETMKDFDGVECKHFFSGATCSKGGKMFASLTPVGFALKLPDNIRSGVCTSRHHKTNVA